MNSANPGDVIIVEPGTYTENIIISKNNLVIRSESGNPANTIIAANNPNASVITIQDKSDITIKGFNITGAGTNFSGIYVLRSPNCIIEDNILYNDALGVSLKTSDHTVVRNNTASKASQGGYGINIEQSNYTTVLSNTISNQNYGINILGSKGNTLSGNTVSKSAIDAIVVENSLNNVLENNTVKSNVRYGIYLRGSSNNSLRDNSVSNGTNVICLVWSPGNTISGNEVDFGSEHDIFLDNSSDNSLPNNIISSSPYGIAVRYSNNNNLTGNNAYNNTQGFYITLTSSNNTLSENKANSNTGSGISLYRVSDNVLENNEANSNSNQGIILDHSNNNEVFNNIASQNSRGIYISSSSSGNTISNNTVNSNTGRGIGLDNAGSNNNLTSNIVSSNGVYGIYLVNSNNTNLISNTALRNSGKGIYIINSSGNLVSGNTVSDNGEDGIMLSTSTSNILYRNKAVNNSYGIDMSSSQSNTISSNNVTLSRNSGLYLCAQSINNSIFDNYLNNTFNVDNKNSGGHWNKTKTSGTNVVGGPYIGGNYWASPLGSGFSQTATDANEDGIADSQYSGDHLIDYLPLVAVYVPEPEPVLPVANFSTNVTSGNAPLSVLFTDLSQNATSRSWKFGDGANSTNQNPTHSYLSAGNYTVNLTVSNPNGTDSKTAVITVLEEEEDEIDVLPVADFSTSAASGSAPLSVLFTDHSQNATSRIWKFGDGTNSTARNPTHSYYRAGNYTVNLTVSNLKGTDSKTAVITVLEEEEEEIDVLPVANFSTSVNSGSAPLSVLFTDLSQNAISRGWDFGDGANSTEQNPTHSYSLAGNYTVNLTVSNPNGTDSKTAFITVLEEEEEGEEEIDVLPVANFETNVTSGYAPLSVLFTDLSQNTTSRSWDVNNDGIEDSNEASFVYVYTSTGTYTAKLTAINANGTDTKTTLIAVERQSSGGSSSGGGGGGSPESSTNIEVKELSQVFITNGNPVKFDFTKNATCVVYVSFDAKKTAGKTTTIAEQLKGKSSLVSELPSGEVYKSFNVWVGNSGFATSTNIENPVICFRVAKAWIQDKKIDQSSIALNRYSNKTWEQLPVSLSSEDEKYLYFTAKTPGFASFVITGKANTSPEETVTEIRPVDESGNSEENMGNTASEVDPKPVQEESSTPGFEMVYGVAGLLAVFLYKRK